LVNVREETVDIILMNQWTRGYLLIETAVRWLAHGTIISQCCTIPISEF
jgi:hypothetical protein